MTSYTAEFYKKVEHFISKLDEEITDHNVLRGTVTVIHLVIYCSRTQGRKTMFKATLEIATEIAHDLNLRREFVWEIIKGMRYNSVEELEIRVCKAIAGH